MIEDAVILVKVSPDGYFEKQFMSEWGRLKTKFNVAEVGVCLYDLFGYKWPVSGEPVNLYILQFNTMDDLEKAMNGLQDFFFKLSSTCPDDGEHIAEVMYGKPKEE